MGKEIDLDDFDFGFTAIDKDEIVNRNQYDNSLDRIENIKKMIMPLLNNLKSQEGDYIFWPNRKEKIDQFIKKLNEA